MLKMPVAFCLGQKLVALALLLQYALHTFVLART